MELGQGGNQHSLDMKKHAVLYTSNCDNSSEQDQTLISNLFLLPHENLYREKFTPIYLFLAYFTACSTRYAISIGDCWTENMLFLSSNEQQTLQLITSVRSLTSGDLQQLAIAM